MFHINLINVLRQRVAIIAPFNASDAMSKDVRAIGFIASYRIAMLLCKLSQI
jgi:hypothetical protein